MPDIKEKAVRRRLGKKGICLIICALVVLSAAVGTSIYAANSGFFLRHTNCLKSDGYNADNAMLSYFFKTEYNDFVTENNNSLNRMGLNTQMPLKKQECTYYSGYDTWYDYFMAQAKNKLINYVCYASEAKKKGYELDKADKAGIESAVESIKSAAQSSGKSTNDYIADYYGKGVNESDVRRCLELSYLAGDFYAEYENSLKYTDEQLEEQYKKSAEKYDLVSYKCYTIETRYSAKSSDEAKKKAVKEFLKNGKQEAEKIASAKNEKEFDEYLADYIKRYNKVSGVSRTDAEINTSIAHTLKEDCKYSSASDDLKWAFDASRKKYDTAVFYDDTEKSYDVCILTVVRHRRNYITKNVRHILMTEEQYDNDPADTLTAAQECLRLALESDDVEKKFSELAKQYSQDSVTAKNGGLCENIQKEGTDKTFAEWCYYPERKHGDTAVIKTSYGYHAMYFIGDGLVSWQADAADEKKKEDFAALIEKLKKEYNLQFNDNAARSLNF